MLFRERSVVYGMLGKDSTYQEIVTANPWSLAAILCGVFMALFKAANFAKLTVQWIIRMRKRHLRNKARQQGIPN